MNRVTVDFEKKALITLGIFKREYPWNELSKVTICRSTPALFDELSVVFDTKNSQFFINKGDAEFLKVQKLIKELNIDSYLPQGWYTKAEAGHVFTVELNNKKITRHSRKSN